MIEIPFLTVAVFCRQQLVLLLKVEAGTCLVLVLVWECS